ncbi:hypothetical protein MRX96_040327, partial [Rhipicephalus microplus]
KHLEEMAAFRAVRPRRQVEAGRNDCEMSTTAACRDQEHIEEQERQEQIHAALVQYGMGPLPVHDEKVTQEQVRNGKSLLVLSRIVAIQLFTI